MEPSSATKTLTAGIGTRAISRSSFFRHSHSLSVASNWMPDATPAPAMIKLEWSPLYDLGKQGTAQILLLVVIHKPYRCGLIQCVHVFPVKLIG